MKLLFDQNVSPKLATRLADLFPGSAHVDPLGMGSADDSQLWDFARANGLTIVSKDEDFNLLSLARGFPPKVIWLLLGNCTTQQVEDALRAEHAAIEALSNDPAKGTLIIR
jgi:predicted nuclease of predicted toxin-antitoxin system